MKNVTAKEARDRFVSLLAEVEAGEEVAVTRQGRIVARLVPAAPPMAVQAFHDLWTEDGDDLCAPDDPPAEAVVDAD